ncbi:FAD-dependent monooxygenase [Sphingomonas sp. NFR15]|uniref:FAD-dependent monooxygenase n=1 Tax=Sphingomonas sp. NFR15 TaxID=1566282 RepID=UPI0008868E5D|nr:FAD-dependent monooxygenase [Sphingomonas sp. NFR15]SDA35844.1 2-polyprenyl-6-methoxyphenol hydroxylase [Sphingomonas sp. NFR15]
MDVEKKILICGAGIAGPACAYWLDKYGYAVVLVERAKGFRDGGQNVDIKGAGQQVIKRMGLDKEIEARDTLEQGQRYVDDAGNLIATFPKGSVGTLTSDFEILRGDFARVLFDATKADCEYRFGTFVTYLDDGDAGMSVTFNDGTTEDFELVICAEGISSATRAKVLAEETGFRYLGAYMSFFKIPRRPEDDNWAISVNGAGGTFITLRPGNDHETTVLVTFLKKDHRIEEDSPAVRRQMLVEALKGRGTIADRILAELDAVGDFYFGPMSQVRASTWSKGRFVTIGDAAHCPTPFTGAGTALALVGAYVLAGEISKGDSFAEAFAAYERRVRPYAEATQNQLSQSFIRLLHAKTWFGITLTHLAQRFFASSPVQKLLRPSDAKRQQAVMDDFDLPDYS